MGNFQVIRLKDSKILNIYWIMRKDNGLIYGLTFVDEAWKFIPMEGLIPISELDRLVEEDNDNRININQNNNGLYMGNNYRGRYNTREYHTDNEYDNDMDDDYYEE